MVQRLEREVWQARRAAHEARVDGWTRPHLERSGRKHPVEDFLFTYYSHRPAKLRRWSPGPEVVLEQHPVDAPYVETEGGAVLPAPPERIRTTARFVADLLSRTAARPAQLGCFGMHEWAMVYRGQRRHEDWPLRLGQAGTDDVVEALGVRCSHHDAFRFFTEAARPLNVLQPTREAQLEHEQPGCLHANMDLYKWSYKLALGGVGARRGLLRPRPPGARPRHGGLAVRPPRPRPGAGAGRDDRRQVQVRRAAARLRGRGSRASRPGAAGPSAAARRRGPGGHRQRVIDWLLRDRRTGGWTLVQKPNLPLTVWLATTAARWVGHPHGDIRTALDVVGTAALVVWAGDEVLRGVNPARRILGGAVLAALVASRVR